MNLLHKLEHEMPPQTTSTHTSRSSPHPPPPVVLLQEYLDAYGPGQAPAVIAIGSWDRPLVTLFLLTTPHKSKNNAPRGPSPTALPLVEIATWCPTRRPWPTVDTLACGNVQNQGAGPGRDSVPVRAIAFVRPGGDFGCLAMVAGRADGMVAVTELQSSMYRGAGWMREADGTSWGELCTCALFQVVRGPVRFEVLPMSTEHGEEGGGGGRCGDDEAKEGGLVSRGERVLVNGYEDALVHRCSGSERSAGRQRDLWQCTPVQTRQLSVGYKHFKRTPLRPPSRK